MPISNHTQTIFDHLEALYKADCEKTMQIKNTAELSVYKQYRAACREELAVYVTSEIALTENFSLLGLVRKIDEMYYEMRRTAGFYQMLEKAAGSMVLPSEALKSIEGQINHPELVMAWETVQELITSDLRHVLKSNDYIANQPDSQIDTPFFGDYELHTLARILIRARARAGIHTFWMEKQNELSN